MNAKLSAAVRGAAAGAAGTVALNAATYVDMALRGRPASTTPQQTVERLAGGVRIDVPGDEEKRSNRINGLGPLLGLATGVATGALLGGLRGVGVRPRLAASAVVTALVAMLAGNGPMAVSGVTNPRSWSATDWLADVVPHLAYGAVTAAVLELTEDGLR